MPFIIEAGISALGKLLGGITGMFSSKAEAAVHERNALMASQQAGVNSEIAYQQGEGVAAEGAVRAAANGGGLVGSSLGVITNLSQQAMFNARAQIYRGQVASQGELYQAAVAKNQGQRALIGGVVGAASSVAGGFLQSSIESRYITAQNASHGEAAFNFGNSPVTGGAY